MAVIHVLKDGTVLKDISGHVVKREDVPNVYALIEQMNKKGSYGRNQQKLSRTGGQNR